MTIWQAFVLGIIQGITEFLPVSSSAHLVITQQWFGLEGPMLLVFDVVVHAGTLTAILIYFAKDLFPYPKIGARMMTLVILASIPTAIIGFCLQEWVEYFFTTLRPVAVALLVNSAVLFSTKWIRPEAPTQACGWRNALWIGVVQGISVIPGISRSGSTLSTGLWFKLPREEAVRFSFFLAIPAIVGAMLVVLPESFSYLPQSAWRVLAVGFSSALVFGYVAIAVLFKVVLKSRLHYFAFYTLFLSGVAFVFSFFQS